MSNIFGSLLNKSNNQSLPLGGEKRT
jgi:hypothetical protein